MCYRCRRLQREDMDRITCGGVRRPRTEEGGGRRRTERRGKRSQVRIGERGWRECISFVSGRRRPMSVKLNDACRNRTRSAYSPRSQSFGQPLHRASTNNSCLVRGPCGGRRGFCCYTPPSRGSVSPRWCCTLQSRVKHVAAPPQVPHTVRSRLASGAKIDGPTFKA